MDYALYCFPKHLIFKWGRLYRGIPSVFKKFDRFAVFFFSLATYFIIFK